MPSSRADRARRHQSQTTNESNTSSMSNGQESVQMIRGRGLRKVIRHSGKDYYQLLDDTGASQSEAASISLGSGNLTVTTTTSSGTGEGVTVHGDLTGKANDDHTQYVHNDTARTITANHTFSGRPIFNGGTNSLSPFTVNEDTLVANLNADKWDGYEFSDYLNQAVLTTSAPTFATVNTGQGANELYAMNQNVRSTDAVTFATVDTGQGANELYDMNQNVLTSSDVTFADLTTSGDILVQGDDISSDPFTSGFTGSGWKIDNTGTAEFSNASIRGTLSVYELLLQQLRATNGSVLITAVAKIESIDGNDLTFEDPSDNGVCPFHTNDIVMVQRANITGSASGDSGGGTLNVIKRLVRRVTSVSGRTITVTRDGDLPSDTDSFAVGDDVVRIGNTTNTNRDAILYLSADDSKAPYLIIKDGVNSWANWGSASTEKARLGRLDGITDTDVGLDGNQANLYGLYSDAVYLKGHINATSGTIGGVNITNGSLSISSSNISDVNAYTTNQDRQTFDGLLDDSPSGTGFFMDANKLGYYTSSAWKTYMGKNGDFALAGTGGSGEGSLTWDSSTSTLTIAGSITVKNPNDFAPTDATANQSDATTNNAIAAKSKVFYQDGAPSSGHSTNDIWYDTNDGYKRYVYNGSSWVNSADTTYDQSSLITNAQNTANARNTTFFQSSAPTANAIGDLWVDTDDNYKLWRASAANNSSWQAATPDPDVNTTTIIGNTVTTGFVNALNVNANTVSAGWVYAGNLTAEQIQTAGGSFAATKNYDMRGSTNSWIVDYASITAYTGYTTVQGASSQNGTRLRSPTFSGVHGERDRYIKIRIRRQAGTGWYGRLYWIGNAGSYSDSRYALVPNPSSTAEDSWTTLLIDMWDLNVGGTAWKTDTAITNLRLDMGTTASDNFDIQYIGIGDVTDTPGTFIDGDGIYTGTINADNINAGTMTGRTVQTTGGGTKLDDTGDFGDLSPSEN